MLLYHIKRLKSLKLVYFLSFILFFLFCLFYLSLFVVCFSRFWWTRNFFFKWYIKTPKTNTNRKWTRLGLDKEKMREIWNFFIRLIAAHNSYSRRMKGIYQQNWNKKNQNRRLWGNKITKHTIWYMKRYHRYYPLSFERKTALDINRKEMWNRKLSFNYKLSLLNVRFVWLSSCFDFYCMSTF